MKNSYTKWWVIGTAIVLAGLIIWSISANNQLKNLSNRELAMTCTTHEATKFHIHPTLKIFIGAEEQLIPANIGITDNCMKTLHTHDSTGVIHIESEEPRDFSVGDFFAVWSKTFNEDQIFDHKSDLLHGVFIKVNGQKVHTYENTVLRDKDEIIITYGGKK